MPFREIDVSRDAAAGQEMVRLSGQRGVPVVTIDKQVIVGFDRSGIDRALASAQRPRLGAAVASAADMRAQGRCNTGRGAYVGSVHPGGVADRAGVRVGDVIVAFGNQDVQSDVHLQQLLAGVTRAVALRCVWCAKISHSNVC